jgi:hypothetical protein
VEELVFDTVVEEVSVEELESAEVCVIEGLLLSDSDPHDVEVSEGDGVVEGLKDPLPETDCESVSVYDTVFAELLLPEVVADLLPE